MPRKPRIDLAGYVYHVMARGNNRRKIYLEDRDFLRFGQLLRRMKEKYEILVYVWMLMPNHYHLLVKPTRDGTLSRLMQSLNTGYTGYFNRKYERCGHLFQGRYKSILVERETHFLELIRYIHCNPVRAELVENPQDYTYSSYLDYFTDGHAGMVEKDEVLELFGKRRETQLRRFTEFVNEQRQRSVYDPDRFLRNLLHGDGVIGSKKFEQEVNLRLRELRGS